MSAFIPMVSTTPPPIDDDDDDFGDFMDGGDENDEFADFSTPKDYDDFSYPSLNPSSDNVNSLDQETDNEESSNNVMPALDEETEDDNNDQEVKRVMANRYRENSVNVSTKPGIVESENRIQMSCNGDAVEDDWFSPASDDHTAPFSKDEKNNEHCLNEQPNFFKDSVPTNDEHKAEDETNSDHDHDDNLFDIEPSANISKQSLELNTGCFPDNSDAIIHTTDDLVASESSVTYCIDQVETPPGVDQQNETFYDDQLETEITDTIPASEEYLSDDCKDDGHLHDFEETDIPRESISSKTAHSLDSANAEDAEDTSDDYDNSFSQQPAFVSDSSGCQTQAENQRHSELGKIDVAVGNQDITVVSCDSVDQQDAQCSQTSINTSDVIHDPVPESKGNEHSPVGSDQNLSFHANFGDADDEDDFADFGSFDAQSFTAPENENLHKSPDAEFNAFENTATSVDHSDGFADFTNADTNEVAHDSGDFGGFSNTNIDDNDDFGDFNSNSESWTGFSDTVTNKLTFHEKVNSFVSRYAVEVNAGADVPIPHLDEHLISDTLSKDVESPSVASVESAGVVWPGDLWDQLEDIDNTVALNFVWNGSHHNKYLLDALGMQTQNILFSGTKQAYYVPTYYAAALGMVDPSKGVMKPMSAAEKITAMSPTEKNFPVVGEVSAEEAHPEWKTIADEQTSGRGMTVASSWLHSDRSVCNQDDNQISSKSVPILSSAMDLDYFDNLPTATENPKLSGGTDLIDPELLEVTSAPTTEPPPPPKDPGSATLSKILASIKGDSNAATLLTTQYSQHQDNSEWVDEENKLSAEARSVLQKLPDLSYMRSKVLLFPMNMSRMTIGEE